MLVAISTSRGSAPLSFISVARLSSLTTASSDASGSSAAPALMTSWTNNPHPPTTTPLCDPRWRAAPARGEGDQRLSPHRASMATGQHILWACAMRSRIGAGVCCRRRASAFVFGQLGGRPPTAHPRRGMNGTRRVNSLALRRGRIPTRRADSALTSRAPSRPQRREPRPGFRLRLDGEAVLPTHSVDIQHQLVPKS